MYPLPSFSQWKYLTKIWYNITSRIVTLIQSRQKRVPSSQGSLLLPFHSYAHFFPNPFPLWPLPTTHIHFRNGLIKCVTMRLAFSLRKILWRFIQIVVCISCVFLLLLNSVPWCGCTTVCSSTHPLKDLCAIPNLELLERKLL